MADITEIKLPDATVFTVKDPNAQPKTLTTPLTINGNSETTVEGALDGLNDYGDALKDNLAAIEEYGTKNLIPYPFYETTKAHNGITFTDNGDGSITVSGTASANASFFITINSNNEKRLDYEYPLTFSGTPSNSYGIFSYVDLYDSNNQFYQEITDSGAGGTLPTGYYPYSIGISVPSGANISTPIVIKPMLRDARILDPTFVPFAKTNLQLTNDKAERNDLSTIHATGSTNTTGAQINAGTFFYLNGSFCKALQNIAVNATFTLNTNYKEDTVGAEIKAVENKDTSSFSVSTESGVSLQKAICRNGFVYLQLYFDALANSTKIATITDANYLPEGGNAVGLIEPNLSAEKINYTYGSFSGSNVYVYVSGSPTSGGIITFVYPVTGY